MSALSVNANAFSSPETERRDAQEAIAAMLDEGMRLHGVGVTQIARAIGVSRQLANQYRQGTRPLQARHVLALPEPLRGWLLNRMAKELGLIVGDRLEASPRGVRGIAEDLSGAVYELLRASKGRAITRAQSSVLRRIGTRFIRAGAGLQNLADEVDKEGVVGVEE